MGGNSLRKRWEWPFTRKRLETTFRRHQGYQCVNVEEFSLGKARHTSGHACTRARAVANRYKLTFCVKKARVQCPPCRPDLGDAWDEQMFSDKLLRGCCCLAALNCLYTVVRLYAVTRGGRDSNGRWGRKGTGWRVGMRGAKWRWWSILSPHADKLKMSGRLWRQSMCIYSHTHTNTISLPFPC